MDDSKRGNQQQRFSTSKNHEITNMNKSQSPVSDDFVFVLLKVTAMYRCIVCSSSQLWPWSEEEEEEGRRDTVLFLLSVVDF